MGEGESLLSFADFQVNMLRRAIAVAIAVAVLALSWACERERAVGEKEAPPPEAVVEAVSISDVLGDAALYSGKEVTISGEALPGMAFEFVDEQPYQLRDETGTIWVITSGVMPAEGARITVKGKVATPYQIKGRRFDVAIIEEERRE